MKNATIRARVLVAVVGCFVVAILAVFATTALSWKRTVALVGRQSLDRARAGLANLESSDTRTLEAALEGLLVDEKIQAAYRSRDEAALHALVAPLFDRLRKNHDITHWYFIDPDGTCFLRVHDPARRGDAVKRATFLAAKESGGFGTGKELGKTAFALRVVHPWKDASGAIVGYLELGQEIDHFLARLKSQTGSDYALLIDKAALDREDWASVRKAANRVDNWDDHPSVVLTGATGPDDRLVDYHGSPAAIPDSGLVLDVTETAGRTVFRGVVPVTDASGRKAGALFVLEDVSVFLSGMKQARTNILLTLSVLMVGLGTFLVVLLQRIVFARLDHSIDVATRVVGGDFESRIVVIADDEVGRLESLLEQFRQVFVNTLHELHPGTKTPPKS